MTMTMKKIEEALALLENLQIPVQIGNKVRVRDLKWALANFEDKRKYKRYDISLETEIGGKPAKIENISQGGAFISGPSANKDASVSLSLDGLMLTGLVAWAGPKGVGIEFVKLLPTHIVMDIIKE